MNAENKFLTCTRGMRMAPPTSTHSGTHFPTIPITVEASEWIDSKMSAHSCSKSSSVSTS